MNSNFDDKDTLNLKAAKVTNETLASTRRMLGLVHESQDAGAKTLEMLHAQGDQLNNVESGLDDIQESLLRSEKHLKDIKRNEQCCCCVFCRRKNRKYDKIQNRKPTNGDGKYDANKNINAMCSPSLANQKSTVQNKNFRGQDDVESNLEEISAHIGTLKSQALDMGQVVESHNKQIDRLNIKAETGNNKIGEVTERTNNLLSITSLKNSKCCRYCNII